MEQKVVKVADVAATKLQKYTIIVLGICFLSLPLEAAVLPEERADALLHTYNGGGVEITGPSILVRKQMGASTSVSANYYMDMVSSASIDVITTGASPYKEERTETSIGVDYLHDKTTMSLGYTKSEENDYSANSLHFNISMDMFGDLTTVSMGYSLGADKVSRNLDPGFGEKDIDRQQYRLGLTQVLSKNLLLGIGYEAITDEGFLNNPYRSVRYLNPGNTVGFQEEKYPNTRTSNALAFRTRYYLPYRAAIHGEYRLFSDDWGIDANTFEIGYTHPTKNGWEFEIKYRYYNQGSADFYNDLFPRVNAQNFLARDKELSTFSSQTIGLGASYEFVRGWKFIDKGTLNIMYDHILFDYEDFRDTRQVGTPGQEPLYGFSANVIQLFASIWF